MIGRQGLQIIMSEKPSSPAYGEGTEEEGRVAKNGFSMESKGREGKRTVRATVSSSEGDGNDGEEEDDRFKLVEVCGRAEISADSREGEKVRMTHRT